MQIHFVSVISQEYFLFHTYDKSHVLHNVLKNTSNGAKRDYVLCIKTECKSNRKSETTERPLQTETTFNNWSCIQQCITDIQQFRDFQQSSKRRLLKIFVNTFKKSLKLFNICFKLFQGIHMHIQNFKHMSICKQKTIL